MDRIVAIGNHLCNLCAYHYLGRAYQASLAASFVSPATPIHFSPSFRISTHWLF